MAPKRRVASSFSSPASNDDEDEDRSLMARVIQQNNMGVNYFEKKEYSNAFHCFRQALILFKASVQQDHQEEQDDEEDNEQNMNLDEDKSFSSSTTTKPRGASSTRSSNSNEDIMEEQDNKEDHCTYHTTPPPLLPLSFTAACVAIGEVPQHDDDPSSSSAASTSFLLPPLTSTSSSTASAVDHDQEEALSSSGEQQEYQRTNHKKKPKNKEQQEGSEDQLQGSTAPSSAAGDYIGSSCFAVHARCIRLLPARTRRTTRTRSEPLFFSTDTNCESRIVSAVLVFNCGLVFHLQGQRTCSYGHLEKAVSLYQQVVSLLEDEIYKATLTSNKNKYGQEGGSTTSTTNPLVEFLCMAGLNNMGLILRCDFLEHEKSRLCFDRLVSCVHAFDPEEPVDEDDEDEQEQEQEQACIRILYSIVDEFLLNAVALNCVNQVCAPSA